MRIASQSQSSGKTPHLRQRNRTAAGPAHFLFFTLLLLFEAETSQASDGATQVGDARRGMPTVISIRPHASDLERLAASEVRRYLYLRTDRPVPIKAGATGEGRIVVATKDRGWCGNIGERLEAQQFELNTTGDPAGGRTWWVVGGDAVGTLYGAYRFAEHLGVQFSVEDDVLPDDRLTGPLPNVAETGKPRFTLRGLQPFHDFSVGPDWWNVHDYQSVLSQMTKMRMNFIGLHTYPSWNPSAGPEANVWIGPPEDVDRHGDVKTAYEAGVVTTRRGWEVRPFPTQRYASGAQLLFESDDYGPDFMLECLDWPKREPDAVAMFNRYGDFQQRVFAHARRLGVKTCLGTEVPLGIPSALRARLAAKGLNPDDPVVIRRLYEGMFLRLRRKLPLDYYWLWTPEIWLGAEPGCAGWEVTTRENVERDLGLIGAAAQAADVPFGFATCGWRLGTRDDALWLHRRTPLSWAASSINTGLGGDPVEKAYGSMPGRPKWVIGWAEDDNTAGAHCCTCWDLQLGVQRIFTNAREAKGYGCDGLMAIHWRTAAISPNLMALAKAGWDLSSPGQPANRQESGRDSMGEAEAYWLDWGRAMFGNEVGAEAGSVLRKLDGSHGPINGLVGGGAATTDQQISDVFAPLRELEALRPHIRGDGNRDRLDYWVGLIGATEHRVHTWVLASRLSLKLKAAASLPGADARSAWVRQEILPRRLELARRYEHLIGTLVSCAKSPGEVGTISSIESGMRERVVSANDKEIEKLLGEPLPSTAQIRSAYDGAPRIFVSSRPGHLNVKEPQEMRAFVLSREPCRNLSLYWRPLGQGTFRAAPSMHRSRQAYRVNLPTERRRTLEYYLEATLANDQQVRWPATAPRLNATAIVW